MDGREGDRGEEEEEEEEKKKSLTFVKKKKWITKKLLCYTQCSRVPLCSYSLSLENYV